MSRPTHFIGANFCDHGAHLLSSCHHCNRIFVWRMIRNALVLVLPFWMAIGLALVWWLR